MRSELPAEEFFSELGARQDRYSRLSRLGRLAIKLSSLGITGGSVPWVCLGQAWSVGYNNYGRAWLLGLLSGARSLGPH